MSLRFTKRIKLLPGLTINVGKTGISASVGVRGARMTFHSDGSRRSTVGIPGTGISSSTITRAKRTAEPETIAVSRLPATPELPCSSSAARGRLYFAVFAASLTLLVLLHFFG